MLLFPSHDRHQETKVTAVREEPAPRPCEESAAKIAARTGKEKQLRDFENWMLIGTGTPQQQKSAMTALISSNPNLVDIKIDNETKRGNFVYADGTTVPFNVTNNARDWATAGIQFHGLEGSQMDKSMSKYIDKPMVKDFSATRGLSKNLYSKQSAVNSLIESIPSSVFENETGENIASNLNKILKHI